MATFAEREDKKEAILAKYGAEDVKSYCLISNYGYTFKLNAYTYDIRYWANCYGFALNKWEAWISSCEDDSIPAPAEIVAEIVREFNEDGA